MATINSLSLSLIFSKFVVGFTILFEGDFAKICSKTFPLVLMWAQAVITLKAGHVSQTSYEAH
jgi:hypothetical protein